MRLLIVSPTLPYPPNSGGNIRNYQCIRLLSRRHTVVLVSYADRDATANAEAITALSRVCSAVHTVPPPRTTGRGKRLRQLTQLLSSKSYQATHLYTDAMQAKLDELSGRGAFDVIQLELSQLGVFRFDGRTPIVLDTHDIVYELLERIARSERSLWRRLHNWAEYRKFKVEEQALWRRMSACVVTSAREVPVVRSAGVTAPVIAVPNAVDVEYFLPSGDAVDENAIVMTGLMRTRPNADGAVFAVEQILPRILERRPEAVLYLVGGQPPREVERLRGPHVVVTGNVPDVRPFLRRAAVSIVPLRMGGGTRLKVLEGLSMKKPMVSTSIGIEGLDVAHDRHLLVADEPQAFADAVLRLMDDSRLGARLAEAGYELVHHRYKWETAVETLEGLYASLVAERQGLADGAA